MHRSIAIVMMETARLTSFLFFFFHVQSQSACALGIRIKSRETKTVQYYCVFVLDRECILNKRDRQIV